MNSELRRDAYLDAVPISELLVAIVNRLEICNQTSLENIRRCAENIVKQEVCPCVAGEACILEAVIEEYCRRISDQREGAEEINEQKL